MSRFAPTPARLWWWSTRLHERRVPVLPRVLKLVNLLVFSAVLPPEAVIERDIVIEHYGLGLVVHPNVRVGRRVHMWHGVTLASQTTLGSPHGIVIEDDVMLGAGSTIIARPNTTLRIGAGASVGAGAVVVADVPAGATVVGVPAKIVRMRPA